jgi:uncharacterized membrane protein
VGSAPNVEVFDEGKASRAEFADRAGALMGMAAESFADGLRAYYMSFAVIGWFVSPGVFAVLTLAVLWVLYRREFRSDVSKVLKADTRMSAALGGATRETQQASLSSADPP